MYGIFALVNLVCINENISNFPVSLHSKDINTGVFLKCTYGIKKTHKGSGKATRVILPFFPVADEIFLESSFLSDFHIPKIAYIRPFQYMIQNDNKTS